LMRTFDTGATRDTDEGKFDYEGFLSPLVLERYAEYMHQHRKQADGKMRDSDNWQKGIPPQQDLKSAWRHFLDVWKLMRGFRCKVTLEDALCALLFNIMGLLFEIIKKRQATRTCGECGKFSGGLGGKYGCFHVDPETDAGSFRCWVSEVHGE
jgi:hypothetical protein